MTSSETGDHAPAHDSEQSVQSVQSVQPRIATALAGLDTLDTRPLGEHVPVYDRLHDELQAVLAEIDGA